MFVVTICGFTFSVQGQESGGLQLSHLRCEMLVNPQGIDNIYPRLSWEINGTERNIQQKAYQILVASSAKKLIGDKGDLWNSGKVVSDHSININYAGKMLTSRVQCFWKVKIWTNHGNAKWSGPAYWSMGLLHEDDWKAAWIGLDRSFPWDRANTKFSRLSARYFRKEWNVEGKIKRATAYITGLGFYKLYINRRQIGNQVLVPAPTDYTKTVLYNTYDVTGEIRQGKNAIGTVLGNGLFFTMRLLLPKHGMGWGYMEANGATTTWELWNGNKANPQMSSLNHVMLLGDLLVWFYEDMAGIKTGKEHPGFKQIEMRPLVMDSVSFVNASYRSIHGLIKSHWEKKDGYFTWHIAIPGNTTTIVYIPALSRYEITEEGKKILSEADIKFLRMEKGRAVFTIGSGDYSFVSRL